MIRNPGVVFGIASLVGWLTACPPAEKPPPVACTSPNVLCSATCTNLQNDPANCGACGVGCSVRFGGTPVCLHGVCDAVCNETNATRCPVPGSASLVSCVDLQIDPANCGTCGTTCSGACTGGRCDGTLTCGDGSQFCGATCVNIVNDVHNCGGCGITCEAPVGGTTACVSGRCAPSCAAPAALCDAAAGHDAGVHLGCVDVTRDPVNCGGCGNVCLPQQQCDKGQCTNCPAGQLQCPIAGSPGLTTCKAILSDNNNCGGCGSSCATGSSCQNGVCVTPGLSNCGSPPDGGAATLVDLQNDPKNCGSCGTVCTPGEICSAGDCIPCPVASCDNKCVDTQRDPANCGDCGTACTGTKTCVDGTCQAPLLLTILPPTSTGKVGSTAGTPTAPRVRVDSALPIYRVVMDQTNLLPDGGPALLPDGGIATARTFLDLASAANESPTQWTSPSAVSLAPGAAAHLVFSAWDVAWRPDGGDASLHQDSRAVDVVGQAPPAGTPSFAITAGGTSLSVQSAFIPLNGPPVTLTAAAGSSTAPGVQFVNLSANYVLGTSSYDGGSASLTVQPADLTSPSGPTVISACPIDGAGQMGTCQLDGGIPNLVVGKVPTIAGANPAFLTSLPDGGAPTILFMTNPGSSGATVQPISAIAVIASAAAAPVPPNPGFPGYRVDSLVPGPASNLALATRFDGSAVDSFDCADGICTQAAYVVAGAGPSLGRVLAASGKAVLIQDANPFGLDVAAFGAVPATAAQLFGGLAVTNNGAAAIGVTRSGAIAFVVNGDGILQAWIVHPTLGGRNAASLGLPFQGVLLDFQVNAGGEVVWHYQDFSATRWVAGAAFDGAGSIIAMAPVQVGQASPYGWTVVRPNVLIGVGADLSGQSTRVHVLDLARQKLSIPAGLFSGTGNNYAGVRGRLMTREYWAVSDDQLKIIHTTVDPAPNDPNGTSATLWITDLATADAQAGSAPLYGSPWLAGAIAAPPTLDFVPHFVHSASGTVSVTGGQPSLALASPPAVVWGEVLSNGAAPAGSPFGAAFVPVRPYYALYASGATPPATVQVDRLAVVGNQPLLFRGTTPVASPLAVDSAAAQSLFFVDYLDSALYAAPVNAVSGRATSTRVTGPIRAFSLREDMGRLLVHRSDGVLLAARLSPGALPALQSVYEGLLSGPIDPEYGIASPQAGFTPDGAHAWTFAQVGSDLASNYLPAQSVLVTIDLDTGARTGYGRAFFNLSGFSTPQACFLANASFALGLSPLSVGSSAARLFWSSASTAPAQSDLGLGILSPPTPLVAASGFNDVQPCMQSLDGSEAWAQGADLATGILRAAGVSPSFGYGGNLVFPFLPAYANFSFQNVIAAPTSLIAPTSPATWSPFGGRYLDAYDLIAAKRQGPGDCFNCGADAGQVAGALFKVWGESASGGFPFVTVSTGFVPTMSSTIASNLPAIPLTRATTGNEALLFSFNAQGNSSGTATEAFTMWLRLAGRTPPPRPLP